MICLKLIKLSYDYSHSNYDHAYQARSIVFYKVYRCVRGGGEQNTKQNKPTTISPIFKILIPRWGWGMIVVRYTENFYFF